uniref:Uncharacterized protein n=1 Tax=Oryza glumipatula TaxID=40148 RepID=A0A0D9Y7P2_9ORYZ
MREFSAEMCAPHCLPLVSPSLSDIDTGFALALLKEFVKCLSVQATKDLILHIIQKILQACTRIFTSEGFLASRIVEKKMANKHVDFLEKVLLSGKFFPCVGMLYSCIESSKINKPEPQQSWNSFALMDGLSALEGLCISPISQQFSQSFFRINLSSYKGSYAEYGYICASTTKRAFSAELEFSHESSGLSVPTKGFLLYPFLAALVGTEKLRECCSTWFL